MTIADCDASGHNADPHRRVIIGRGRVRYFGDAKVEHLSDRYSPRGNKVPLNTPAEAPVIGECPGKLVTLISGESVGALRGVGAGARCPRPSRYHL